MDYEQFCVAMQEEIAKSLKNEGVEVTRHDVVKNNGVVMDGLTLHYPGKQVSPTVYLNTMYDRYKEGKTIDQIADRLIMTLESEKINIPELPPLMRSTAEANLYLVAINYEENKEMLKDVPYERFEDLVIVPRFRVGYNGSFLVKNELCSSFQMTPEEVLEQARINTANQEYRCRSMGEVLKEIMLDQGMPDDYAEELLHTPGECPMWVISNASGVDGAICMTLPEVLEEAHSIIKDDYYILPSSKHEIIAVPTSVTHNVEDLRDMVREINQTQVDKIDRLSDSIYKYDGRQLTRVESRTEQKDRVIADALPKSHTHNR